VKTSRFVDFGGYGESVQGADRKIALNGGRLQNLELLIRRRSDGVGFS
jgi:hypothetical protein